MHLAWLWCCLSQFTNNLAYLHTQNNKNDYYYASDNKSEDSKSIDYRYIIMYQLAVHYGI